VNVKNQNGFTLIEALVAAAILAIGFAGVYGLVQGSNTFFEKSLAKEQRRFLHTEILDYVAIRYWHKSPVGKFNRVVLDAECDQWDLNVFESDEVNKLSRWCLRVKDEKSRSGVGLDTNRFLLVSRIDAGVWVVRIAEGSQEDYLIRDARVLVDPENT